MSNFKRSRVATSLLGNSSEDANEFVSLLNERLYFGIAEQGGLDNAKPVTRLASFLFGNTHLVCKIPPRLTAVRFLDICTH